MIPRPRPARSVVPHAISAFYRPACVLACLSAFLCPQGVHAAPPPLFSCDFQRTAPGKLPDGFQILDGNFALVQDGTNQCLELPGAPLDTFGVLFGPPETNGLSVSARFHSSSKGRSYPAFALGLYGLGGFRLQLAPAKRQLELYRGEISVASVPYQWETGAWTWLKLRAQPASDGTWTAQGKVWKDGTPEPASWLLTYSDPKPPSGGRSSLWGNPFSGLPIRFDDLEIRRLPSGSVQ